MTGPAEGPTKGKVTQRFVINGVEYDSVEAMPPEVRELLAQALADAAAPAETSTSAAPAPSSPPGGAPAPGPAPPTRVIHEHVEATAVEGDEALQALAEMKGLPPEFFLRAGSASDPKKHPVYHTVLRWGYGSAGVLALLIAVFLFVFR